uniref:VWFD domain-containing protein n=1 Tax=Panagrolaimus davidi TaxID=227884 RepID=A0A914QJX4_9BILA
MIFLRFFIFTIIGFAFGQSFGLRLRVVNILADETKEIEITFKDEGIQHCSVTCPRFPSNIQHNLICESQPLTQQSTDPSTTDPSTTDPSTTDPSTTDPSTTDPSTTDPSTTDPSTTDPSTKDPSTKDPSTKDPSTKDPSTKDPSTKDPSTKDPSTKDPSTKDPSTKDPSTKDPSTKDPSTKDPSTKDPSTKDPSTKDPSTKDPSTKDPSTKDPSTKDPSTKDPSTKDPSTKDPSTPRSNLCGEIKKQVCLNGDPHYRTFDGSHFEYQGTCPHIFVERCNGTDDFDYFSVKVKNQKFGKYENKISILSTNNNESGIQVYLDAHTLCVDIPDCPEYFGTDKLCGLAGSYNGYCGDDLVYRDKTMLKGQGYPCRYGNKVNKWANSWTTNNYFWPSKNKTCELGVDVDTTEDRKCDDAIRVCEPIRSALKGIKAFAQCKVLDYSEIYSEYGKCVDHICEKNIPKCDALQKFADFCGSRLKDVQLKPWRKELHCSDEDNNEQTFFVN